MLKQLMPDQFDSEGPIDAQRDILPQTESGLAQILVALAIAGAVEMKHLLGASPVTANQDQIPPTKNKVGYGRSLINAAACLTLAAGAVTTLTGCQQEPERPAQRQAIRSIYYDLKLSLPLKRVNADGGLTFSTSKALKGAPESQISYKDIYGVQCLALKFAQGEEFLHVVDDEVLKAGDNVDFHRVLRINASRLKDDSLPLFDRYALSENFKVDHVGVIEFTNGKHIILSTPQGKFISFQNFQTINQHGEATFVHESLFRAIVKNKPAMFGKPLTVDESDSEKRRDATPLPEPEEVKPVEPTPEAPKIEPQEPKDDSRPPEAIQPAEAESAITTYLPNSKTIDVVDVGLDKPEEKAKLDALRPQLQSFLTDIITQSQDNLVVIQLSDWWCGACHAVAPVLLEVARQFDQEKADIQFRRIEGTAHRDLVEEFFKRITTDSRALDYLQDPTMPTFLFIRDGRLVKLESGNYLFGDEMGLDLDTSRQALNRLRKGNYGALFTPRKDDPLAKPKKRPELPNFKTVILDDVPQARMFQSDYEIPDEATQRANLKRFLAEAVKNSESRLVILAVNKKGALPLGSALRASARELHKQGINLEFRQIADNSDTKNGILHQAVLAEALRQMNGNDPAVLSKVEEYLANLRTPSYILVKEGSIVGITDSDAFYDHASDLPNIGKMIRVLKNCADGDCSEMLK